MTHAHINAALPWLLALILAIVAGASCAQSRARVPHVTMTAGEGSVRCEVSP